MMLEGMCLNLKVGYPEDIDHGLILTLNLGVN